MTENMAGPTEDVADQYTTGDGETTPPPPPASIASTAPPLDEDKVDDVAAPEEAQEMVSDGVSVQRGTKKSTRRPPKHRRWFANLEKVKRIVKCTGLIEIMYDDFIKGPLG
ncbi:hypothetical protein ACLB2K_049938 [Fragaria x ananassa]